MTLSLPSNPTRPEPMIIRTPPPPNCCQCIADSLQTAYNELVANNDEKLRTLTAHIEVKLCL